MLKYLKLHLNAIDKIAITMNNEIKMELVLVIAKAIPISEEIIMTIPPLVIYVLIKIIKLTSISPRLIIEMLQHDMPIIKIIKITAPQIFSSKFNFISIPRLIVAPIKHNEQYKNNNPSTIDTNNARLVFASPILPIIYIS